MSRQSVLVLWRLPAPDSPVVSASASASTVTVSWDPAEYAASYRVERSLDESSWETVATTDGLTVDDVNRQYETTYYYRVTAINVTGESSPGTASVTTGTGSDDFLAADWLAADWLTGGGDPPDSPSSTPGKVFDLRGRNLLRQPQSGRYSLIIE